MMQFIMFQEMQILNCYLNLSFYISKLIRKIPNEKKISYIIILIIGFFHVCFF